MVDGRAPTFVVPYGRIALVDQSAVAIYETGNAVGSEGLVTTDGEHLCLPNNLHNIVHIVKCEILLY